MSLKQEEEFHASENVPPKNRAEKIKQIREQIIEESKNGTSKREENITLISSLVKYDTPFLLSTNETNKKSQDETNKKTLEELDVDEEKAEKFLRDIIYSFDEEEEKRQSESANKKKSKELKKYSVRDALNKILPPKKIVQDIKDERLKNFSQIWVQNYKISCIYANFLLILQRISEKREFFNSNFLI